MAGAPPMRPDRDRPPRYGESLNGYIARRAAAEGLPNALEITSSGGAEWSCRAELSRGADDIGMVAGLLGAEPEELDRRTYHADPCDRERRLYYGASMDRRFLAHSTRRFSPSTLRADGFHRAVWDLRPFPFCDASWEFLVDKCPDADCRAVQRWYHTHGVDLCDRCGEPLSNAATGSVAVADRTDLRAALGLVHPDPTRRTEAVGLLPEELRPVPPGELLDLLVGVAGVHDPAIRCRNHRRVLAGGAPAAAVTTAMAAAWRVLRAWPDGFEALAAERIATRPGRFGDGNHGATIAFVETDTENPLPPQANRLVTDLRRRLGTVALERGIGSRPASELPFLTASRLADLRRRRVIGTVFALVDGEPQPLLDRSEVQTLSDRLCGSRTIADVARAIGTTSNGIEQLVSIGRLVAEDVPATVDEDGACRVRSASVDDLVSALQEGSCDDCGPWPSLSLAMRMIGGRLKPWGPVVEALLGGRIRYHLAAGSGPLMDRVRIEECSLRRPAGLVFEDVGRFRFLECMSKTDALAVLNLHARHGQKELARWPTARGGQRTVPVPEVLELAAAKISMGETAARLGAPSVETVRILDRWQVERRGPWCSRPEVERLVLGSAAITPTASEAADVRDG